MRNKIKELLKSFSARVTIITCIILIVCSLIWTSIMFVNMRNNAINNLISEENDFIEQTISNVNNIEEVCNMALEIVSQLDSVVDYLEDVQNGKDLDTQEKIDFYNTDIVAIYNITNLNPYLNQIRLFVDSENITEKKPCLYQKKRMYNLEWGYGRVDGKWNIDYEDSVFPDSISNYHLAGLTKTMYNSTGKELGVIEVATTMEALFPDTYQTNKDTWSCFVTSDGEVLYNEEAAGYPSSFATVNKYVGIAGTENGVYQTTIDGERVLLSTTYIESFDGTYVHITKLDNHINSYYNSQKAYIYVVAVSLILCVIMVAFITKNMFKRFNSITESITRIKKGETGLRVDDDGDDEISEMGSQINQMLDNLQHLNEENTNRQLIVKNTEIKAMQNQINAHFMYNVLESIKMMAEIEEQYQISDAVTSLGEMFRYSVKWTSGKVALKEELQYVRNYLALMNLRLDSEVVLSLNIPDKFMNYKIPKMSLQPIVENSIMHGIKDNEGNISIYVKVFVIDDILHIEVSDTGRGMSHIELHAVKEKLKGEVKLDEANVHGLALKNVQNRVKMYYGDEYGLEVYSEPGLYTKVVILMPYEKGEDKNNE